MRYLLNCSAASFQPGCFYWRFEPRGDNGRFTNKPDIIEVTQEGDGYHDHCIEFVHKPHTGSEVYLPDSMLHGNEDAFARGLTELKAHS